MGYALSRPCAASPRLFDSAEVKDIVSYLTLALRPNDSAAFTRAVGAPRRGVGDAGVAAVIAAAAASRVSVLSACRDMAATVASGGGGGGSGVTVGARGLTTAAWKALAGFARVVDQLRERIGLKAAGGGGTGATTTIPTTGGTNVVPAPVPAKRQESLRAFGLTTLPAPTTATAKGDSDGASGAGSSDGRDSEGTIATAVRQLVRDINYVEFVTVRGVRSLPLSNCCV